MIPYRGQTKSGEIFEPVVKGDTDVHALVNSERTSQDSEPKSARNAFKANCEKLNIRCHLTHRRAIENYFTDQAIKAEFGQEKVALQHFDSMPSDNNLIGKSDGWRAAQRMSKNELDATDLGEFFQEI